MDATDRIAKLYDRLLALGPDRIATRPLPEQIVFYVVAARCEIDINGFDSVYEQLLKQSELSTLIKGLNQIDEERLAGDFQRGFELLKSEGFYDHMNWNEVTRSVKAKINTIGKRVGDRLWKLDEKLAKLVDQNKRSRA